MARSRIKNIIPKKTKKDLLLIGIFPDFISRAICLRTCGF